MDSSWPFAVGRLDADSAGRTEAREAATPLPIVFLKNFRRESLAALLAIPIPLTVDGAEEFSSWACGLHEAGRTRRVRLVMHGLIVALHLYRRQ